MTSTPVRTLPLNTIFPVRGTSHRQDNVHTVVEYDEIRIRHDTINAHDPNACSVETLAGVQLGFVPRELAARLAVPHPGGRWRARVEEVFRKETWGLRVRLGPLIEDGVHERAGEREPGLRHAGDGVLETEDGAVTPEPVDTVADAEEGAQTPAGDAAVPAEPVPVFAKTGRRLGDLLELDGTRVIVATAAGRTAYPAAVVRVG